MLVFYFLVCKFILTDSVYLGSLGMSRLYGVEMGDFGLGIVFFFEYSFFIYKMEK